MVLLAVPDKLKVRYFMGQDNAAGIMAGAGGGKSWRYGVISCLCAQIQTLMEDICFDNRPK